MAHMECYIRLTLSGPIYNPAVRTAKLFVDTTTHIQGSQCHYSLRSAP